ncbi:hypothetical protein Lal_00019039 [Lupinus albus]|nr:hypothetical protein Lal_00019039 [Lupinus albus]
MVCGLELSLLSLDYRIIVQRPVFPIFGHQRVFLRFDCKKRSDDSKPVMQPVFGRKSGPNNYININACKLASLVQVIN